MAQVARPPADVADWIDDYLYSTTRTSPPPTPTGAPAAAAAAPAPPGLPTLAVPTTPGP